MTIATAKKPFNLVTAIKAAFGKRETPEEKRMRAELEYRAQERNFTRYDRDLCKSADKFKNMAVEAEQLGQHGNALRATRFLNQIEGTRSKVMRVRQHFEMLHVLAGVGDVMTLFMDTCAQMGCDLSTQIDLDTIAMGEMSMEKGLLALDTLSDKMEQVFDTMNRTLETDPAYGHEDAETEAALAKILAEAKGTAPAEPVAPVAKPVEAPAAAPAAAEEAKVEEVPANKLSSDVERALSEITGRLNALSAN